jgi:hypothetical protein
VCPLLTTPFFFTCRNRAFIILHLAKIFGVGPVVAVVLAEYVLWFPSPILVFVIVPHAAPALACFFIPRASLAMFYDTHPAMVIMLTIVAVASHTMQGSRPSREISFREVRTQKPNDFWIIKGLY